jgi:hypothetical protein
MSLWSRIRSRFARSTVVDPAVRLRDDGFDLVNEPDKAVASTVRWSDVARIQAYKLDLITTDCICLLFEFGLGRAPIQVSEEWPGFADLFGPLSNAFPSIPESWYVEVMSPTFEAKRRVLYDAARSQRPAVV